MPWKNSGGGTGALSVPSDLEFAGANKAACETARDAFLTANPARKVDKVRVMLKPTGAAIVLQQWDAGATTWRDQTAVVRGPQGDVASNLVLSVAGRQGDVVLAKADVGLPNVADLAPADLPVSTATQAAIDAIGPKETTFIRTTTDVTLTGQYGRVDVFAAAARTVTLPAKTAKARWDVYNDSFQLNDLTVKDDVGGVVCLIPSGSAYSVYVNTDSGVNNWDTVELKGKKPPYLSSDYYNFDAPIWMTLAEGGYVMEASGGQIGMLQNLPSGWSTAGLSGIRFHVNVSEEVNQRRYTVWFDAVGGNSYRGREASRLGNSGAWKHHAYLDDAAANLTVVNDLTTGGAAAALSAEQGKTLATNKLDANKVGAVSGVCELDASRLVPSNRLPAHVTSVAGRTGAVTLTATDVGLNLVENIANADRGISNDTQTALDLKLNADRVGVNNGVCELDAAGKVPSGRLGSITTASSKVVASTAARLAWSAAGVGSVAVQSDTSESWILSATPPATEANWIKLLFPASVTSVNGQTSSVTLNASHVGAVPVSSFASKGSIISGSATASTPVATAAGADGQFLVADAASPGGLKWFTLAAASTIADNLTTNDAAQVLSAAQGVAIKTALDTKLATADVVNDLTTGGAAKALSAEQGKTLKTAVDARITSLSVAALETDVVITPDVGTAITLPLASTADAGVMSPTDKVKLNGIAVGATAVAMATATPLALGTAAVGTSAKAAREDHVHPRELAYWDKANSYAAGARVLNRGIICEAVAAIGPNVDFKWGTTGAVWKPLLQGNWTGPYVKSKAYAVGDLFVPGDWDNAPLFRVDAAYTAAGGAADGTAQFWADCINAGGVGVSKVSPLLSLSNGIWYGEYTMAGATATLAGRQGMAPKPSAGDQDKLLCGGGFWTTSKLGATMGKRRNVVQSITSADNPVVKFDTDDAFGSFNAGSSGLTYDSSTGQFKNTSGKRGAWQVSFVVSYVAGNATGNRLAWIMVQGDYGNRFAQAIKAGSDGNDPILTGSATICLDNDQYFEIRTYQDSGVSRDIGGGMAGQAAGYSVRMQACRMFI